MKRLNFRALVTFLTLAILSVSVESYGQILTKKEHKQLQKEQRREQIQNWLATLKPSPITVTFDSQPQGAKVIVDGKVVGTTPVTAKLNVTYNDVGGASLNKVIQSLKSENQINVKFVKEGYVAGEEYLIPYIEYGYRGIAGYKFSWPEGVFCELKRDENTVVSQNTNNPDNSIPAGETQKVVSRDAPGQTALERTIIRWYFESQPQGARIYWRVISSIPDQVKNTNELWLGNTPFEETRSFNIQGLTYENSRDVQIEIKVRRQGYIDQTKRFNVRQAIDQMEISSFFDMIKAEEE